MSAARRPADDVAGYSRPMETGEELTLATTSCGASRLGLPSPNGQTGLSLSLSGLLIKRVSARAVR
jgi:hypothetical protein